MLLRVRPGDMVELRGAAGDFIVTEMRQAFCGRWCTFHAVHSPRTMLRFEADVKAIVARAVQA